MAPNVFSMGLKKERIRRKTYTTRKSARDDVFDYIEFFYNPKRKHGNNKMLSPIDFEKQQLWKQQGVYFYIDQHQFFVYHSVMFAEDTYFLDLYILSTIALMITSIVQCWLTDKVKLKKIIWTAVIVLTWPVFILGTLVFAFIHYKVWRKIIPLLIVVLLGIGAYFQLMDWAEKIPETAARIQHFEEQMNGIDDNAVSRQTNPLLYEWVETESLEMLNLSKESYEAQLDNNKRLFTQDGYASYYEALKRAQIIQGLSKNEMDIVFNVNNSSIKAYNLENQNKDEWIKEPADWIVNVPGSILYRHINKPNAFNATVTIIVKEQTDGFKATQLIVKPE